MPPAQAVPVGALAAVAQAGFDGTMSAFRSAGEPASRIASLAWILVAVAALVTLLVVGAAVAGALRRRGPDAAAGDGAAAREEPARRAHRERRAARVVVAAVGASLVALLGFLVADFTVGRHLAAVPQADDALRIRVTGHQWWWEVEYQDPLPSRMVRAANEIRVPVGRTVVLELRSADVIHSLWVPALDGKKDLVPGRVTTTWFRADRPGAFRGQCAEFCGHQHAHMGLEVIAEPPERFAAWYERQLQPASAPAAPAAQAGERVFLTKGCVLCHTVRGTPAQSRFGPDLTHLASRRTLAAGRLPNTRGHLAGWIVDPQRIKPGVRMPPNQLEPEELHALLAYLEGLR